MTDTLYLAWRYLVFNRWKTGILIAALHHAGVATLTYTPSPMEFLRDVMGRPKNERAFMLLAAGYPAADAQVPAIRRKSPDEIITAITTENVKLLQSIKGIGAKSAQRIVIDLKDKLAKEDYITEEKYTQSHNTLINDALTALTSLGFNRKQAEKALDKAFTGHKDTGSALSVEGLIREALKLL